MNRHWNISGRPKWLMVASALFLCLAIPYARLAQHPSVSTLIECCCGEHEADHDCGCLDCPGARHQKELKEKAEGHEEEHLTDLIKPCGLPQVGILMPELFRYRLEPGPALALRVPKKVRYPRPPAEIWRSTSMAPDAPPG